MVFLKLKNSEEDQFLFETKTDIDVEHVLHDLVQVFNKRLQLTALISETEELIKYGVMREPESQGIDEMINNLKIEEVTNDNVQEDEEQLNADQTKDPSHRRLGNPPSDERIIATLKKTVDEAKFYISKEQALQKKCLTLDGLEEMINNIKGAIAIAYPMGLPKYDSISFILSTDFTHNDMYIDDKTTLWFAGKELQRGQKLQETKSIGRNEKTMIIVKLSKKGSGPPAREPPLTEEMQRNLMAYYYKKQEEQKKLLEDSDDNYVNSVWADPKGLRNHFQGINNIDWK